MIWAKTRLFDEFELPLVSPQVGKYSVGMTAEPAELKSVSLSNLVLDNSTNCLQKKELS